MRSYDALNKCYRDMTPEEIAEMNAQAEQAEREYWANIPYEEAVEAEIAKHYTIKQELAIQRQKEEKPQEYAEYYAYCEACKEYVKSKKGVK